MFVLDLGQRAKGLLTATFRLVTGHPPDNLPELSWPRLLAGVVGLALAYAKASTSRAAAATCPNEQVREESNINPSTGQPYSQDLPECRAYEMVSPLEKGGSSVTGYLGFPAAVDGDAVGFSSQNAFGDAEGYRVGGLGAAENPYVSRRTPAGWVTSSALAPARLTGNASFDGFDGDASPDLLTIADCGIQVVTNNLAGVGAVCALREPDGSWLVTPPFPNTTGNMYSAAEAGETIQYEGSSSDLSDVVFESVGGADGGAAFLPADISTNTGDALYEVAGLGSASPELRLVNVDNGGNEIGANESARIGGLGDPEQPAGIGCSSNGLSESSSTYQAISADGQTIYFTACPSNNANGGANEIYARVDASRTVDISDPAEEGAAECTICKATPASAAFEGAAADGSKAFFLTSQELVNGDTDTSTDLYEYDFDDPPGKNLVQLSAGGPGDLSPGSGADVQGVVRTSSDGSHVYFVATGVLTTVPNAVGEIAQGGADNLYAVDTTTDETKFVADLCSAVQESGTADDPQCPATPISATFDSPLGGIDEGRRAQTTPDGRYLVFTTYARLIATGSEADTSEAQQVYRYDFETGQLVRVSIGEPSFPASHNGNTSGMNATVDALPAGGKGVALASINDDSRAISDDGSTIVFATPEPLQADDINVGSEPSCSSADGTGCDVYAWHACAGGGCDDGMAGEVSMISPGNDPTSADTDDGLASMSESGSDIFFFTQKGLVAQDTDQLIDVYDARIDGGFPAPRPEPSCSGEACQGNPSSAPTFGMPGTQSFTGGGNQAAQPFRPIEEDTAKKPTTKPLTRPQKLAKALTACKKEAKRQRVRCEKSARAKYDTAKESLRFNCRHYGVVPLGVEVVSLDLHGGELLVGDFDLGGVGVLVKAGVDLQAGAGGGRGDQVDHDLAADEGLCAPVDRDVAEQAVLDLVPL